MKPNLMLITVDQMRRDCMSAAGNTAIETPNLDAMCRQGIRFTHAYSATPTCIPARAALLTGMSQEHHGRVGYEDGINWEYAHTLAGELTAAGYQTQCVGKMHVHPQRNRCGFDNVVLHDGYMHAVRSSKNATAEAYEGTDDYLHWLRTQCGHKADLTDSGLDCNSWVARPWPYAEQYHPTNWCAEETIDFFRRRDITKPFFLHTSFVRPHSPLDPPQYYFDMYKDSKDLPMPVIGDWEDTEDLAQDGQMTDCKWGIVSTKAIRRARGAYYGLITHIDHQIGRILQAMGEYNLLENTVVVFTSDHGDLLGDHNLFRKAFPYEGSAGIPLFVYDPGDLLHLNKGTVKDDLVELRDIMPTLLDLAKAPIPDTVDGKSLCPILQGKGEEPRDYLHGEHSLAEHSTQFIVTKTDKYIWYSQSGEEQYFNLEKDPQELHNAIAEQSAQCRIQALRALLIKELACREEQYTDGTRLIKGQKPLNVLRSVLGEV
ncbi:MAG: arylsulfatase [Oscillospiraceae bacterium]